MLSLAERLPNEQDARSLLVQLTRKGRSLIDRAVEAHIENERQLVSLLPASALSALDAHLSALLLALESPPAPGAPANPAPRQATRHKGAERG